ncbi:hypothetical protein H7H37_05775, partial [Mycolicibacterium insubricum]|nr:hypothetical protein [Mycolicibacterium insubricum]
PSRCIAEEGFPGGHPIEFAAALPGTLLIDPAVHAAAALADERTGAGRAPS